MVVTAGAALVVVLDSPDAPVVVSTLGVTVANPAPAAPCIEMIGPPVPTPTGRMQVSASVTADGRVCSVRALQVPSGTPRSIRINNRAVPLLADQAVSVSAGAPPGQIDGVSGATFTSSAYRTSLQAILDAVQPAPPPA
jgi:hypothetical protein